MVALMVVVVCLLAIALPTWVPNGRRTKDREARDHLKSAFTSQKAFFGEKDAFGDTFTQVGFWTERGNRYAYFMAEDGPLQDRSAQVEVVPDGGSAIIGSDVFKGYTRVAGPFSAAGCPLTLKRAEPGLALKLGRVHTRIEDDAVVMAAAGNLDDDPLLDCWSIATVGRVAASGETIPAGQPFHEQSDLDTP